MSPIDDGIREELSALLDGALPEERAAELRRRLETDEALRREYDSLRRTVDAVRAMPHVGAPPELRIRIDAALRGQPARAAIFRFGMLAAAAAVVLAAGLFYFLRQGPSPSYEAKEESRAVELQDAVRPQEEDALIVTPDSPARERAGDAFAERGDRGRGGGGAGVGGTEAAPSAEVRLEERQEGGAKAPAPGAVRALEESERKADVGAPASEAAEPPPAEDEAQEPATDGRPAGMRREVHERRGTGKAKEADLLRVVEKEKRLSAADRQAYLRQLASLGPEEARQHVLTIFGGGAAGRRFLQETLGRDAAEAPALLAAISLTDRDEAALVTRILGAVPLESDEPAASVSFSAMAKDQIATEVEGTPDELARIRRWLALVDLDQALAEPDVMISGATTKAKEVPKRVRAIVRLKYPPRPEPDQPPAPGGPAPAGDK